MLHTGIHTPKPVVLHNVWMQVSWGCTAVVTEPSWGCTAVVTEPSWAVVTEPSWGGGASHVMRHEQESEGVNLQNPEGK